jgi:hypothetical protein
VTRNGQKVARHLHVFALAGVMSMRSYVLRANGNSIIVLSTGTERKDAGAT